MLTMVLTTGMRLGELIDLKMTINQMLTSINSSYYTVSIEEDEPENYLILSSFSIYCKVRRL